MKLENLFEWYKTTREWNKLSKNSKIFYDQMMGHALKKFPIMDKVHRITPNIVDEWYDELITANQKHRAVSIMKVMRRIWNVAKRKGLVTENPFEKMGLATLPSRNTLWPKETITKFIAKAEELKLPHISLLVDMCYNLGQRPGDIIPLKVSDYNSIEDTIKVFIHKTKKTVIIPIYQPFKGKLKRAMNSETVKRWGTFLPQFTYSQYNRDYRLIRDALKLPKTLQLRDIRHTALTEIMEAGATDAEGQAISAHSNRDMLNVYAPSTVTMAKSAMEKRFGINNKGLEDSDDFA